MTHRLTTLMSIQSMLPRWGFKNSDFPILTHKLNRLLLMNETDFNSALTIYWDGIIKYYVIARAERT